MNPAVRRDDDDEECAYCGAEELLFSDGNAEPICWDCAKSHTRGYMR